MDGTYGGLASPVRVKEIVIEILSAAKDDRWGENEGKSEETFRFAQGDNGVSELWAELETVWHQG
jgi:hypothetical protein